MPGPVNHERGRVVDGLLQGLARLVCPPRCLVCGEAGDGGEEACRACRTVLPWNRHACPRCALPMAAAPASARFPAAPRPVAASTGARTWTMPVVGLGSGPDAASAPWTGAGRCADVVQAPGFAQTTTTADDAPTPVSCAACLASSSPLQAVHAAFVYRFPLDHLLPRFKFHRDLAAGRQLSAWMAESLQDVARPDVLLPLPLHRARLRSRGYDQALELARPLARRLDLPIDATLLRRIRHTAPQSSLDAAERRRNLRGAFAVDPRRISRAGRGRRSPLPAHVVLVDDVMTTGATLHAAADALHRAGIARIDAWLCARVP